LDSSWVMYALLLVLIALSAFFSATETAFSTVNKIRLKHYADNGNKRAKTALDITDRFDQALSTILVGNNIVNLTSSSIATVLAVSLFGDYGPAISTIFITVIVLIFGEILPKSLANENSEAFTLAVSRVLRILMKLFYPVVFLFLKLKEFVVRLSRSGEASPSVTEDELKYIVESIEEEGVLEQQESELVQHALEFDEKTAQEVLTPRVDMLTIDVEDDLDVNTRIILEERYSRIPVYQGSIDNIIGILHTRDFLEAVIHGRSLDIRSMLQPAFFIYKTKRLSSLLNDFKRNKMHLAIVADDYGGILGMVTMEDLLEQLVGDIWDEDEEEEHKFIRLPDGSFEITGDLNILELFDLLDLSPRNFNSEYNAVGGWAMEKLGHIPKVGEQFAYESLHLTIQEMDDQRVTKLIVRDSSQCVQTAQPQDQKIEDEKNTG
jgi:putative hemolysin